MKWTLLQSVTAATLQFIHTDPFTSGNCIDRFDSVLNDDSDVALQYKLNVWMPRGELCHYHEMNGKGTISLDHEEKSFSGTLRQHSQLFTFNGTEDHLSIVEAVYDLPGQCESVSNNHNPISRQKQRQRREVGDHTYLELVFVVSSGIWETNDKSIKNVRKYFEQVYNIMAEHYKQADINLLLLDIMVTKKNPFELIDENHSENLDKFLNWRRNTKKRGEVEERFDRADSILHFIPQSKFDGHTIGLAFTDVMCNQMSVGIVAADQNNAAAVAATASHELGHNYGMSHDTENDPNESCRCPDGANQCIMSAIISSRTPSSWSDCSHAKLTDAKDKHTCLKDKPAPDLLYGEPFCGNGILEKGEDCDCGSSAECTCCTEECKLPPGAECSPLNGACCTDSCEIKNSGSLCRAIANDCDLAEYCDGESIVCPRNDFKHTGALCADGDGHCYGSECRSRDAQCQSMFGATSAANQQCMEHYNTMPYNYFGGCGAQLNTCTSENAVCGKQYCTGGDQEQAWTGFYEQTSTYNDLTCRSLHSYTRKLKTLNVSLVDESQPGMVQNGVPCRNDHFCILGTCEPIAKYFDCPDCNGRGTCSNHNVCKCDCGWAGDDCSQLAWCQEKFEFALLLMLIISIISLVIALITYIVCVFSCGKRWDFCWSSSAPSAAQKENRQNSKSDQIKVRIGSWDDTELQTQLPSSNAVMAPLIVKPKTTANEKSSGKNSIKNKGYEDHKLLFPGQSPPKSKVTVITNTELKQLQRATYTGSTTSIDSNRPTRPPPPPPPGQPLPKPPKKMPPLPKKSPAFPPPPSAMR